MEAVIGHPMGMQDSQSPARPVTLCVLLWANPGTASGLIAYEDKVLGIAAEYGGRVIQRARNGGDDHALEVQPLEIQTLQFPSRQAVDQFMVDERRQALADERDRVVAMTEIIEVQLAS
jgi:uncharacterized protein (DUF1330 family)